MAETAFSILNLRNRTGERRGTPAFYRDLNLDQVLDLLTVGGGKAVRKYYEDLPETAEEEAYRRAVYGDVKKDAVREALERFVKQLSGAAELRREKEKVHDGRQQAVWQLRETEAWGRACIGLAEALERAELSSEGMIRFREILGAFLKSGGFRKRQERAEDVMNRLRGLRLVITLEKDRISVASGGAPETYQALPEQESRPFGNPFSAGAELTELETAVLNILVKREAALFRELPEAAGACGDYEDPVIARFAEEIRFYLSYCALQREMEDKGFAFAVPTVEGPLPPSGKGVYDLALACASVKTGKKVVANDFSYREGESFFVLTGPNQGGKTTFARSLGQLVYFTRMGLDVPAREAHVPFFPDIQTHFSVEESLETGRGKLKEELVRLAPMMEERKQGTFVVINELFTTAASYDAQIMGRRTLKHFIGLGCMGIYVTHLQGLAEGTDRAADLRAMLDGQGVPTFEICRGAGPETACAENQVNKYRLTYAQLKERL